MRASTIVRVNFEFTRRRQWLRLAPIFLILTGACERTPAAQEWVEVDVQTDMQPGPERSTLNPAGTALGLHTILYVAINYNGLPSPVSVAELEQRSQAIHEKYDAVSCGQFGFRGINNPNAAGDVIELTIPETLALPCNGNTVMWAANEAMTAQGIDWEAYRHVAYYSKRGGQGECASGTFAQICGRYSNYGYGGAEFHELGHNLCFKHDGRPNDLAYSGDICEFGLDGPVDCFMRPYGGATPMGHMSYPFSSFNALQYLEAGWITPESVIDVGLEAPETHTIQSLGECGFGGQSTILKIPYDGPYGLKHYYVVYEPNLDEVWVHYGPRDDEPQPGHPYTLQVARLKVGQEYNDSFMGIRIVYEEAGAAGHQVRVDVPNVFKRGDVNGDGLVDIGDAAALLGYLYNSGPLGACLDAADINDSGRADIGDVVYLLNFLFKGGEAPPAPYLESGVDTTIDDILCEG